MRALGPRVDGGSFLRPAGLPGLRSPPHGGPCAPTRGYDFGFRSDSLPSGGSGIFLGGASASGAGCVGGSPDTMVALR